jgi:hypothetical protein
MSTPRTTAREIVRKLFFCTGLNPDLHMATDYGNEYVELIAAAILAEREACLKLAEKDVAIYDECLDKIDAAGDLDDESIDGEWGVYMNKRIAANRIAQAIRGRES